MLVPSHLLAIRLKRSHTGSRVEPFVLHKSSSSSSFEDYLSIERESTELICSAFPFPSGQQHDIVCPGFKIIFLSPYHSQCSERQTDRQSTVQSREIERMIEDVEEQFPMDIQRRQQANEDNSGRHVSTATSWTNWGGTTGNGCTNRTGESN